MDDSRALLELSRQLSTLADRDAYLETAGPRLRALFDADEVIWTDVDLVAGVVDARWGAAPDPALGADLAPHAADHPAIVSYVREPADLRPRRVSDVASDQVWWSGAAYEAVFRGRCGRYQLSLVVSLTAPVTGAGWTLLRDGGDFSDDEVRRAALTLPLLTALELMYRRLPPAGELDDLGGLTQRELGVLRLLATGLPATDIGNPLGIEMRTVRKHLQHVYRKLGAHDRVRALNLARGRGLVP